jgi:ribosomal protein S1
MGDWLAEHEQSVRQWRRGEVVEGVVVSADRDEFLVDIGAKSEAVVPLGEVPQTEVPSVGETVLAYVLSSEDQEGRVVLSLTRARAERGWRNLQKRFEDGQTVEVRSSSITRAVWWSTLRACADSCRSLRSPTSAVAVRTSRSRPDLRR